MFKSELDKLSVSFDKKLQLATSLGTSVDPRVLGIVVDDFLRLENDAFYFEETGEIRRKFTAQEVLDTSVRCGILTGPNQDNTYQWLRDKIQETLYSSLVENRPSSI